MIIKNLIREWLNTCLIEFFVYDKNIFHVLNFPKLTFFILVAKSKSFIRIISHFAIKYSFDKFGKIMVDKIEKKEGEKKKYSSSFHCWDSKSSFLRYLPAGKRKWVIAIAEYFCRNSYSRRGKCDASKKLRRFVQCSQNIKTQLTVIGISRFVGLRAHISRTKDRFFLDEVFNSSTRLTLTTPCETVVGNFGKSSSAARCSHLRIFHSRNCVRSWKIHRPRDE